MSDKLGKSPEKQYWRATCKIHGSVKVAQSAKPYHCKEKIALTERCTRICGCTLKDQTCFIGKNEIPF